MTSKCSATLSRTSRPTAKPKKPIRNISFEIKLELPYIYEKDEHVVSTGKDIIKVYNKLNICSIPSFFKKIVKFTGEI